MNFSLSVLLLTQKRLCRRHIAVFSIHDEAKTRRNAENRTDRTLTFQSNAMSVDGVGIGSVTGSSSVAPQSSGMIRFIGRDPFVTMSPSSITGNIRIIDMTSQPREER